MSDQNAIKKTLIVILLCCTCIMIVFFIHYSTPIIEPSPGPVISINSTIPGIEKNLPFFPVTVVTPAFSAIIPYIFVECTRIQPSGNLKNGTEVTTDITINLYEKFPIEEYIFMNTDLENAVWESKVLVDGVVKSTQPIKTGKESRIPGWLLKYPHGGVQIVISVTGTVPIVQTSEEIIIAGFNILRHTSNGREVLPIDKVTAFVTNSDNDTGEQVTSPVLLPISTIISTPMQSDKASFMDVESVKIQPSGYLNKGSRIIAEYIINLHDTFPTQLDVSMSTNLKDAVWKSEIIVNGVHNTQPTKEGDTYRINGWMLKYPDSDVQVAVSVSGTVPSVQTSADLTIAGIYATRAGGKIISTAKEIKGLVGN